MKRKIINWGQPLLEEEELEAIKDVVKSGWIGGNGPVTKKFQKAFARAVRARYALGVCNGTCGLLLGLLALESRTNIRASVPTWTFIATANTAYHFDPRIELIDCNKTFNIEWKNIPKFSTVIMPVDVGGVPADYDEILKLPFSHYTFADSAESIGATYKGKKMGEVGADLSLFSLHATKVITSGEGGMLTTNDRRLYEEISSINNQGYSTNRKPGTYTHSRIGFNFRITELQSAIGLVQLKKLDRFLKHREALADIYYDLLADKVDYQKIHSDRTSSYFLFTIIVEQSKRNQVVSGLLSKGIRTSRWKPVHMQPPYLKFKYLLPNAEYFSKTTINLPLHNGLTEEEVKYVSKEVLQLLK